MNYLETRTEEHLKFTNPIRDYKHLMVNRIVHQMIELKNMVESTNLKKLMPENFKKDQEPAEETIEEEVPVLSKKASKGKGKKKAKVTKKKTVVEHPLKQSIKAHEAILEKI